MPRRTICVGNWLPGVADVDDPIRKGQELRPKTPVSPAVRVVLAEADAPGALHYLLEAEGFQVVGCASDERELVRVLEQDIRADVIVLDRDITVTSVLVAQTHAPSAQVIVIWPDGVQALTGTRRVAPRLVYEQLGPAVRRSLEAAPVLVAAGSVVSTSDSSTALEEPAAETVAAVPRFARTAARTSVMSIVLIAAVVMTMGAVFAVGGLRVKDRQAQRGGVAAQSAVIRHASTTSPTANASQRPDLPVKTPASCDRSPKGSPNDHASDTAGAAHEERCPTPGGGIANQPDFAGQRPGHQTGKPDDPGTVDTSHGHSGDPHGQSGNPHGQSGDPHGQSGDPHGQNGEHGSAGDAHGQTQDPSGASATPSPDGHGPKS
jgi:hypothetical protein